MDQETRVNFAGKLVVIVLALWGGSALGTEPAGQVVGFYSSGRLVAASPLPEAAEGLVHLFRPRDRGWGSQGLVAILTELAGRIRQRYPDGERMQIGDLSAREGGRISGHASHQNGLDADVAFFRADRQEQSPDATDGFAEDFVVGGKVTANFDLARNWDAMKLLRATGRLNRIFVDSEIKRAFCAYADRLGELDSEVETLRRLRPYPNHDDHFHVRLTCPSTSRECTEQALPATGNGCASAYEIDPDDRP